MTEPTKRLLAAVSALAACFAAGPILCQDHVQPHVINVIADKDSRYKIPGQSHPEIVVKAGEPVLLRVDARKGKTWSREGSIHGFTLLRVKDHAKVPGWNLELMPGTQEFPLTAPSEPGEYEVVCTVICSDDHEGMRMKLIVVR